ncbi:hypothetical protein ZIOFF_020889 [Zingiber officinale]|uniref:Peptidase M14 carboxypeptidase A domain-containing protein n=1 Tax=Zingiber officinale TaxID=94328 RepID=A0A8J5HAN8_ZINOF|nr:hypothetical protein ZIOFF_020889 [Zingiber officinale]
MDLPPRWCALFSFLGERVSKLDEYLPLLLIWLFDSVFRTRFLFQSILIFSLLAFFLFLAAVALGLVSRSLVALIADLSEEWGSHRGQQSSEWIAPSGKKTGVGELPADHKEKCRWGFGKSSLSRLQERLANTTESDALLKEIKATVVRHPDTLTMETIKAGNKGYAAEILVVTYNRHTEDVDDQSKFRILLSFGQHGRELITSEVAWQLLSILAKERNMQRVDLMFIQKLLDSLVIKVHMVVSYVTFYKSATCAARYTVTESVVSIATGFTIAGFTIAESIATYAARFTVAGSAVSIATATLSSVGATCAARFTVTGSVVSITTGFTIAGFTIAESIATYAARFTVAGSAVSIATATLSSVGFTIAGLPLLSLLHLFQLPPSQNQHPLSHLSPLSSSPLLLLWPNPMDTIVIPTIARANAAGEMEVECILSSAAAPTVAIHATIAADSTNIVPNPITAILTRVSRAE